MHTLASQRVDVPTHYYLTIEGTVSWEITPAFDAAFRAALQNGKNVIYVSPPAWWTTLPLFAQIPTSKEESLARTETVIVIPDALGLAECAATLSSLQRLRPAHAATGLTRTGRLLRTARVATLVTTPNDLLNLLARSSIDMSAIDRVVLAWPEMFSDQNPSEAVENVLSECRATQRIVITSNAEQLTDFIERHARRAPTVQASSQVNAASGAARFAVTDFYRIPGSVTAALDILNPTTALVWDPVPGSARAGYQMLNQLDVTYSSDPGAIECDLAIALELPTPEVLAILQETARDVLLLVRASQVPSVHAMLADARPMRLPSESDKVRDQAHLLRQEVRDLIGERHVGGGYLALASLFDEHDPATVAAALATKVSQSGELSLGQVDVPSWIRIRINAGKRHRIRTADLVGALLNAVEVPKNGVGRVDVRDGYSLIEVRADFADKATKGLNGLVMRGVKLAARPDRR